MKSWMKKTTALAAALALSLAGMSSVSACTGIYAGSDVTDDGAMYFGRSEDFGPSYAKVFEVTPRATHAKGEMLTDVDNFSMEYPSVTYRYTIIRDLQESWAEYGFVKEPYAEAGVNEYGVSMSATVSTYDNDKVEEIDPLLYGEGGLTEMSLGTVILQNAKTAREALDNVLAVIDKYGAGECNAIFIADSTEVWYLEIVSGHQYAAIRLDNDKVSVVPNMMMLGQININDENVIASKDLVELPKKAGFLVTESKEEGSIHVAKTYSEGYFTHSTYRAWQGMYILNKELSKSVNPDIVGPSELVPNAIEDTAEGPFYLQFEPSSKVSIKTLMNVLATRGEGSKYDSNVNDKYYPIGNSHQAEDHIFQIRNELPREISTVEWLAMGPAEFSIFVPYYSSLLEKTPDVYLKQSSEFDESSIFWVFDELAILCNENRANVAPVVKAYFNKVQDSIIVQQKTVDSAMQSLYVNNHAKLDDAAHELSDSIANQVYGIALSVLKEVQDYVENGTGEFTLKTNKMPVYSLKEEDSVYAKEIKIEAIAPTYLSQTKPLTLATYEAVYKENNSMDGFAYKVTGYTGSEISFTRELPKEEYSSYKLIQIAGSVTNEVPIKLNEDGTYTFNAKNLNTENCFVLVGIK